jgi:hypothetical protein
MSTEPVNNPENLKHYPYFAVWLQELNRLPEDVFDFSICAQIKEVPSDTQWQKLEQTDDFTVSMDFIDGSHVERTGKWSEGKMLYVGVEKRSVV